MEINKIDHIGIVVTDMDKTVKFYTEILGVKPESIQYTEVPGQLKLAMVQVGKDQLELLEFADKAKRPASDSVHHIAMNIRDISGSLDKLKIQGVPLDNEKPKPGPFGHKIAFINSKATGIKVELVES
jgi:methylmalonyl-CoA/ethylmalonyl-CoA epimerase